MAKKDHAKKQGAAAPADDTPRLSAHPRARRQIRAVKAWSGLVAFILVQYLALHAGLTMFDAVLRGLLVGIGVYVLAWGVAVAVWRQIARAQLEALRRRLTAPPAEGQGA